MKINNVNGIGNYLQCNQNDKNANSKKTSDSQSQKQINELSNIYYAPISFGRKYAEHKSWGAYVNPDTKGVSFKLFTFPDAQEVKVTVLKRNNEQDTKTYTLKNHGHGVFCTEKEIPKEEVQAGDKYFYSIKKADGHIEKVKDPYSFRQESFMENSTIYDHSEYKWKDADWFKNNPNRISRKANAQNKLTPLNAARIFEFNTASYTQKGKFASAEKKLQSIKDEGFNAIEIMPVEGTFSFNWGYDGVDKMSPSEHLGGPDELKKLIDSAHNIGLNVIMDMVPNHLGPDGAALGKTGPYIKGGNCFGDAFKYEGDNSRYVRDFMVNAAMNWIDNYHCDGLRLDMTKFMESDHAMQQIAAEINYHFPEAFLIAEDGRANISVDGYGGFFENHGEPHDKRVLHQLTPNQTGEGISEDAHCEAIENITNNRTTIDRLGYDSEWDFNYFHSLKDALYGNINLDSFEKACYCSQDRVKYTMSHDEIGNFEGSRLISKLMVPMLQLNENIVLSREDKKRAEELSKKNQCSYRDAEQTVTFQKAQLVSEKLAIMLQTGALDNYNTDKIDPNDRNWKNAVEQSFKQKVLKPLGIKTTSGITYSQIKAMYTKSYNKTKMALARTYSIPGQKMVFQGDDQADLTPFRFFREFDSRKNEDFLYYEKGYKPGESALAESKIGSIPYSKDGKTAMRQFKRLTKDLNKLTEENPALTRGSLIAGNTIKHYPSQVIATHAYAEDGDKSNEIFSITNFQDSDYPRSDATDYYIRFPQGTWVEVLNTDDTKYGGTGNFVNSEKIYSDGEHNTPIRMGSWSTLMFKKVD